MIEDKLTQLQRLRLECIAQANVRAPHGTSAEGVVHMAQTFEKYIDSGDQE